MEPDEHRLAHELRDLLTNLIRAAVLSDHPEAASYRREALRLHDLVRAGHDPAELARIRLDGLWTMAVEAAAHTPALEDAPLQVSRRFPATSPVSLGELVEPGLALPALEERIRQAASTG